MKDGNAHITLNVSVATNKQGSRVYGKLIVHVDDTQEEIEELFKEWVWDNIDAQLEERIK